MKRTLLFGIPVFLALSSNAQTVTPTVIGSDGGHASSSGGSISWTIGEPLVETLTAGGNIATTGFHQPELEIINAIAQHEAGGGMLVYPNPVADELLINFRGMTDGAYTLSLTDVAGRLIREDVANVSSEKSLHVLRLNECAAGGYLVTITSKDFSKTVKITKTH